MKKTILALCSTSLLTLLGCATANNTPTGSQSPAPASSASPSPAASPASGSSSGTTVGVSGKASLEQMKAYSVCLKAAGSNGAALSSSLDITLAGAEALIKQGATAQAQGMLDQAYKTIDGLEATYKIDCLK